MNQKKQIMNCKILVLILLMISSVSFSQKGNSLWKISVNNKTVSKSSVDLPQKNLYDLEQSALKKLLVNTPQRSASAGLSSVIISLPNADGGFENFRVYENSVLDSALAERYPEIKSYVAIGVENPNSRAYISNSPLGFKSMVLSPDKSAEFIEPYSSDLTTYAVYKKSDKKKSLTPFECSVIDEASPKMSETAARPNADDSVLRTYRLAMSCTGEYTAYFGGTKALALAAINNSITRCNGVFEKDFGARLVIIANTDLVIYTSASTDPYSSAANLSQWNSQLQSTLTSVIGEANYDIGHLFGATGGGGNAGCIGCICVDGSKGRGYTSPADGIPSGDNFDIDYVAHELGHQMGANHTFSMSNEGTGVNMEPGSGSTIMGYAGITNQDVQPHSDAFFHAISIQQVTNNLKNKTCSVNSATGNAIPTANAGLDYTIPKSTPFMLTGSGTDTNGDSLTYNWEQIDNAASTATGTNSAATATRTTGPTFRSYNSSTSPVRYFPRIQSVLTGATTTAGSEITVEALSSVARNLNFRLTVRDNRAGGPANNSDDVLISVNATAGPFTVSAPNTAVSYAGNSSQTVTWNVAGTTANNVNCANVDILLSTDGGFTYPITLLASTPNDGTQAVTIPNLAGTTNRIMVKGTNHIFFDVSNANFTITNTINDTTPPTAATLSASGTTSNSTNLSWSGATDNIGVSGYDVYQDGVFKASTTSTTFAVNGLSASTAYSFYVISKDAAGNVSQASNTVNVTTLTPDTTAPTTPTLTASGTTSSSTNLSWSGATDNVAVTGYDVYQNGAFKAFTASTTYTAAGLSSSTAYSFYVIAKDAAGNVSQVSNTVNVTTLTPTITYCTSKGNSTANEYINRVQLGTINNTSGNNGGYGNYTSLSTNLSRGTSNTITITPTWIGTALRDAYKVWIDYNQDGDFDDSGEQVVNVAKTKTTPITRSFTVPATASLGTTRMRVSMKYNASPTSCETFANGEVEDYTVNITSSARIEDNNTSLSFNLYPNPVKGDILNISNLELASEYRIFNMLGQELGKGKIENNTIYVGSLNVGTYIIEVSDGISRTTKRFIKQ
jgi:chitodextrinase